MTRDDIYDHLAQVYLGKRKKQDPRKKRQFNAWLLINIVITGIIFASVFYGLTAFLKNRSEHLKSRIILSLHNGPVRLDYNFRNPFPPTKTFALKVPEGEIGKYNQLEFKMRGKEEGLPGIVKVVVHNERNESAYFYVQGVGLGWESYTIAFDEFKQITDWGSLKDVSFVLESWNVDNKKGVVLIDEICFSQSDKI